MWSIFIYNLILYYYGTITSIYYRKLHITNNTKSARLTPTTKDELRSIIEQQVNHQGADADLNNIDVSKVKEMDWLFDGLGVRDIKIDQWDVSNVTTMKYMFVNNKNFNADVSSWDVSNVETWWECFWVVNTSMVIFLSGMYLK